MRHERPSRLPISNTRAPASARGRFGVSARAQRLLWSLAPALLLAAGALTSAACDSGQTDPYCAEGDVTEWLTTFKVSAVWIQDGWSVHQIQLIVDTDNQFYLHIPDEGWAPEGGRVVSALPNDPRQGEAKKVILLPDKGVTAMSVGHTMSCQGIKGKYRVEMTWTGTPAVGDKVDFKIVPDN